MNFTDPLGLAGFPNAPWNYTPPNSLPDNWSGSGGGLLGPAIFGGVCLLETAQKAPVLAIAAAAAWAYFKSKKGYVDSKKGGKQWQRDNSWGNIDPDFWKWWHKNKGKGKPKKDLDSDEMDDAKDEFDSQKGK